MIIKSKIFVLIFVCLPSIICWVFELYTKKYIRYLIFLNFRNISGTL